MNQSEISNLHLHLLEVSTVRQQQLDWCLSKISTLGFEHGCLSERCAPPSNERESTLAPHFFDTVIGKFECAVSGVSTESFNLWYEYVTRTLQLAIDHCVRSVVKDSAAIAGLVPTGAALSPAKHRFVLTGTPFDRPLRLTISCTADIGFKPSVAQSANLLTLTIRPILQVGHTFLPAQTIANLAVGGLLVLRQRTEAGVVVSACIGIRGDQPFYRANWNLEQGTVVIMSASSLLQNQESSSENNLPVGEIAVPVIAQIDLSEITLQQLSTLRVEDVLQTGLHPQSVIVKLAIGGVVFGEGALVQIDSRLAVRITKMIARSE